LLRFLSSRTLFLLDPAIVPDLLKNVLLELDNIHFAILDDNLLGSLYPNGYDASWKNAIKVELTI